MKQSHLFLLQKGGNQANSFMIQQHHYQHHHKCYLTTKLANPYVFMSSYVVECLMLLLLNNQWHDYGFTKSQTLDFLINPPLRTDPYTNVIGCQSWQKSENECINFQQSTGIANREVTLFAHKCKAVVVNTNHPQHASSVLLC